MGTSWRRLTYISFFALFFILTPIFIFLALGYRYNFDTQQLQKNGAFYVKSFPRGAEIFIDNEKYRSKTPTQVTGLAPDTYTLNVTKSGYLPWSKKLPVYSGQTTFAEDIVLWLQDIKKTELSTGGEKYLVNHNQTKYAYADQENNLHVTDTDMGRDFLLTDLKDDFQFIDWSPDSQKLLLQADNGIYIYDINRNLLSKITDEVYEKISWDRSSNDLLWYLDNGAIYRLNINQINEPTASILDIGLGTQIALNDFTMDKNYFFAHYTVSGINILEQYRLDSLESITKITDLNKGNLDVLYADNYKVIFTIGSKLYIKKIFAPLTEIPISLVKIHDQRLLFTNGHEIIEYHFEQDWQNLIDRSTQMVSDLAWHPNGSYFISEVGSKTALYEFDGRDKRNSTEILNNPLKKLYLFNDKGDKLFILTPEENFYLTIQ